MASADLSKCKEDIPSSSTSRLISTAKSPREVPNRQLHDCGDQPDNSTKATGVTMSPQPFEWRSGGTCGAPDCFTRTVVMPVHRSAPGGDFTLDGLMHPRIDLVTRCLTATFFVSYGIRRNARWCGTLHDRAGVHAPRTITVDGAAVKHLRPAERELGALLLRLLAPRSTNPRKLTKAQRKGQQYPTPEHMAAKRAKSSLSPEEAAAADERSRRCLVGIAASAHTFADSVRAAVAGTEGARNGRPAVLLLLDETAPLIDATTAGWQNHVQGGVVIVLGDNRGLTPDEEGVCYDLEREGKVRVVKVSLGPVAMLSSQCIVLIHHYLDRLAHTCTPFVYPEGSKGGRTPAELRGQQPRDAKTYEGWGGGIDAASNSSDHVKS